MADSKPTSTALKLPPALKLRASAYGMSPANSKLDSSLSINSDDILVLESDWEQTLPDVTDCDTQQAGDIEVLKKIEAIKQHFGVYEHFDRIKKWRDPEDPLYSKVKCPFPKEYEFSDSSDSEDDWSEEEIKKHASESRRQYEGRKLRIQFEKESRHIVKRSKILDYLNPHFAKRVSFDTINKIVDDDDTSGLFEETIRMNLMDDGGMGLRQSALDPETFSRGRKGSPGMPNSPTREFSPPFKNEGLTARYHSPHRLTYGQSKIIDIDSFSITRVHEDFEALYDKKQMGPKPVLPGRIIMIYISGRKHTWVALDWLFRAFIEKGDTVIVIAAINPLHYHFRSRSLSRDARNSRRSNAKQKRYLNHLNSPEHVKEVCASIMKYCLLLLDPDMCIKITVELSIGTTTNVLKDMFQLYRPTLIITAAKRRMETFPAVAWRSSKIGDKLVSSFNVPIILVPAINMDLFEFALFLQLRLKYKNMKGDLSTYRHQDFQRTKLNSSLLKSTIDALRVESKKTSDLLKTNESEDESEDSENDDDDNSSIDSQDSEELTRTVSTSSSIANLRKNIELIESELKMQLQLEDRNSPDYFKNLLTNVTDASREAGIKMATIERENGAGASLIRTITGAPTTRKYKSMLDPADPPPMAKSRTADLSSSKPLFKVPEVTIVDDTSPIRPVKSSLRFNISTPEQERKKRESQRKSFSETVSQTGPPRKPALVPMRSSPELNHTGGDKLINDVKDKIRKNKFSSLFKFGRKK